MTVDAEASRKRDRIGIIVVDLGLGLVFGCEVEMKCSVYISSQLACAVWMRLGSKQCSSLSL